MRILKTIAGAGILGAFLVAFVACPFMLGLGQGSECPGSDSGHSPMSDVRMFCCSPATEFQGLASADPCGSRDWSPLVISSPGQEPAVIPIGPCATQVVTTARAAVMPLFLQSHSLLI